MSRIAYVNGAYRPHRDAAVHIEDRGYQFSDGVYEVCAVLGGKLLDEGPHLDRLERSMKALRIAPPMSRRALAVVLRQVLRQNRIADGMVYIQVTRGVAKRDHAFPRPDLPPSLVVAARPVDYGKMIERQRNGIGIRLVEEQRWRRRDIKSVSLLPNVLAKQAAREAGDFEAWQVEENGLVTEGSSTNAWIVKGGALISRRANHDILRGVTRQGLLDVAAALGLKFEERAFSRDEALKADEAFSTSATAFVLPVVKIDGHKIGGGRPGPVGQKLIAAYWDAVERQTGVNYWKARA